MNPLSQLSRLLKRGDGKAEPPVWNCCSEPRQDGESVDLGHANSFEMSLTSCASCGAQWASLFCVANGKSGWERVAAEDAKSPCSRRYPAQSARRGSVLGLTRTHERAGRLQSARSRQSPPVADAGDSVINRSFARRKCGPWTEATSPDALEPHPRTPDFYLIEVS